MTKRDTFLEREDFTNMLYFACLSLPAGNPRPEAGEAPSRLHVFPGGLHLPLPQPAVLKPRPLWTGKQLLTTLLGVVAAGRPPVTCSAKTKVPDDYFGAQARSHLVPDRIRSC